ncbi:MAG: metallophosphoesterase [Paenibacillaceae bacterium]|jgi:hypothetical protein|nr:metallophosphoesterase [Paenibacillaceae bacterium]
MNRVNKAVMIICLAAVLIVTAIAGARWLTRGQTAAQGNPAAPYDLVITIKQDAATSRAFTWLMGTGDPALPGVLEVVAGERAAFTGKDVMRVEAQQSVLQTDGGSRGVYKAEAAGLTPGTVYMYRVGSGADGEWSEPARFSTAEQLQDAVTFINVTDSQGEREADFDLWARTLDKAFAVFPQAAFIVHNGDLTEDPDNSAGWSYFFGKAQNWVSGIPLMPVAGNHEEIDGDATVFASHFNLPDNGADGATTGTSYSFDYGPVHVTVLNTESSRKKQAQWLKEDLAATDRAWKIVAMHRPAYGGNQYEKVEDWTEIFDEYGVDLVLQGHNHEYSRSYPLLGGRITGREDTITGADKGTVYVVTNSSGAKFNEKKDDQFYHKVHFQNHEQMFAGITVSGDALTYQAYDASGRKQDEFVIRR